MLNWASTDLVGRGGFGCHTAFDAGPQVEGGGNGAGAVPCVAVSYGGEGGGQIGLEAGEGRTLSGRQPVGCSRSLDAAAEVFHAFAGLVEQVVKGGDQLGAVEGCGLQRSFDAVQGGFDFAIDRRVGGADAVFVGFPSFVELGELTL